MKNIISFFDFKPKFFTCLKDYDKQKFGQDALADSSTGIRALLLQLHSVCERLSPEKHHHSYVEVSSFLYGVVQRLDWWTTGASSNHLWHCDHPEYGLLGLT